MKKNLLIGNGINQNTNTNLFNAAQISDRFYSLLSQMDYSETELEIKDYLDKWLALKPDTDKNIEQIANNAYYYISDNFDGGSEKFLGSNNEYRLKNILTRTALNAIFIQYDKFISIDIDKKIKDKISTYDNIYTLNYYEYWDNLDRVKYLHGKIKIESQIDKDSINYSNCIFSIKEDEKKSESKAEYPSDNSYPADDSYPGDEIILYEELNELEHIVIFGVSPYADKELMNKIRNIKKRTIFVYNMDKVEIETWKQNIGESTFLDTSEFQNY